MEEKKTKDEYRHYRRESFMTDEEMLEIDDRITRLIQNQGELGDNYSEWEDIETYYKNEQEEVAGRPNTKVNILHANIEGQVAMMIEQNIAIMARGEGAGDEDYAETARIGLDFTLRKNYFKKPLESFVRRYIKNGYAIFHTEFDPKAINGFGLVRIHATPINKFYVDRKIKDILRFQEADYCCETIKLSKKQFKERYGEEKANAVLFGQSNIEDTSVFMEEYSTDDDDSATLIKWWEREDEMLRLVEFSGCGALMYDSAKEGTLMDNQKTAKESDKPYYKYVNNKYPYFIATEYPIEGKMIGFGDGKLVLPLQKMINELYDKIRICARPNLLLYDTDSELDLDDIDENSLTPRPYQGSVTRGNPVQTVAWGTINPSWWELLNSVHQEIQKVTRFSSMMMGQKSSAETATEASIQQQQGNAATEHKKTMIQETLTEMCEYILGLMMEFYTEAKSFRVDKDKNEYKWLDFRQLTKVPVKIPATSKFKQMFKKNNPDAKETRWELLTDNKMPMTKVVDLDIEVSMGAGLPKNKMFIMQTIEKLANMKMIDPTTQQPTSVITLPELRKFLKDLLGIPIEEKELSDMLQQPMPQSPMQPQQPMANPNNAGQGANGGVTMANLNMVKGG